jgi:EAL and modified HD-GYP domain-containing signal transduction protein
MSLLKRIFGSESSVPAQRQRTTPAQQAMVVVPQTQPEPRGSHTFIQREEVADKANRLCGYRIMPRSATPGSGVSSSDYFSALAEENVVRFAERRKIIIPLQVDDIVFNRHGPFLSPNVYMTLPLSSDPGDPEKLYGRLAAIRGAGSKCGVSGMTPDLVTCDFLTEANLVIFDFAQCIISELQAAIATLRQRHPTLGIAIEGVNTWPERRLCATWNVDFCIGAFLLTQEAEESGSELDRGRLSTIQLLNLLRNDAEADELAEVAKRDPGVTFELLRWANSPAVSTGTAITGLQQAIYLLGREQLSRWLTVSMFRKGTNRSRDESLLEIALSRGRFLEGVPVLGLSRAQRDELFLVGLLSVFDVLLSMPMQRIINQMLLSDPVCDVLLQSQGPYAPLLSLILSLERGREEQIAQRLIGLGLQLDDVSRVHREAMAWTQEALSGSFG